MHCFYIPFGSLWVQKLFTINYLYIIISTGRHHKRIRWGEDIEQTTTNINIALKKVVQKFVYTVWRHQYLNSAIRSYNNRQEITWTPMTHDNLNNIATVTSSFRRSYSPGKKVAKSLVYTLRKMCPEFRIISRRFFR